MTKTEQGTIIKLTVFQSGFDQAAALAIAETSPFMLLTLIDKSMLRSYQGSMSNVRYQMDELLRQFVMSHATEMEEVKMAHSAYFARFAKEHYALFQNKRYRDAIQGLLLELNNVRSAWQWSVEKLPTAHLTPTLLEQLSMMVTPLVWFYRERSLLWDGKTILTAGWQAVDRLLQSLRGTNEAHDLLNQVRGQIALGLSQFHYALDEYPEVDQLLAVALTNLKQAGLAEEEAAALELAARTHLRRGNNHETKRLAQQSIDAAEEAGNKLQAVDAIVILARIAADEGEYDRAVELHSRAIQIYRSLNHTVGVARSLANLGCTYRWQGDALAAKPLHEEAYELAKEINNPFLIMFTASNYGWTLSELEDFEGAEQFFQESLEMARESNEQRWIASNLNGMSLNYRRMGDLAQAECCAQEALTIAHEIHVTPDVLGSIAYLGHAWMQQGDIHAALRAVLYADRHPAVLASDRDLNRPVLSALRTAVASHEWAAAEAWQQAQTLDAVVEWIKTALQSQPTHTSYTKQPLSPV